MPTQNGVRSGCIGLWKLATAEDLGPKREEGRERRQSCPPQPTTGDGDGRALLARQHAEGDVLGDERVDV
jgi:hypothetical protein